MGKPGQGLAMSEAAERNSGRPWPPLIVAANAPRWVRWRDFGLTLAMWLLFAIMLETEFELFLSRQLVRLGLGQYRTDPNWADFFDRLMPFIIVVIVLISMLVVASIATLVRRRRTLLLAPPPPLDMTAQAARAGLSEAELATARTLPIAVIHTGPDGRHQVESRPPIAR